MPENRSDANEIELMWGVKIPMRDGILLNATIYKPQINEPGPVIFMLTPYVGDTYHPRGNYFARHGYTFAIVDCRGRGNSDGEFIPWSNQEGLDCYDAIEWLAQQSWCSGQVAMWGGSYMGSVQWLALKEAPAHLKTVVPVASANAAVDVPNYHNIAYPYIIQWLTLVSGASPNNALFAEQSYWIEKFRHLYLNHIPFKDLDQLVGNPSPHFQRFLEHPRQDGYWDRLRLSPAQYGLINLPVLTITGHYDTDQPGALEYYCEHMRYGALEARSQHYLIIGPWDHFGTRTPTPEVGGVRFGSASLLDLNQLHVAWYDWTLKGGPRPEFLKKRVAYYVMGSDTWKYADSFEDISNETRRLYLTSQNSSANDVFNSGWLDESAPGEIPPDQYVYDPLDTCPAELERQEIKNYLTDQRYALNLFGNGLIYHSAPFAEATEISGCVKLSVWMEMDVPDTDFTAVLSEILPDGSHIRLTMDFMRARFRCSRSMEKLVVPGEINLYEFSGFTFFSRQIAKGSRLRLLIQSPNSIFWQKNYNSGGVVAEETTKDARMAHVKLYHDTEYPSNLELPLVIPNGSENRQ